MNDNIPLYNSRLLKQVCEYLELAYPHIDQEDLFKRAGLTSYEINDPGCWICQQKGNLFHDAVEEKTGNPEVIRDAARLIIDSTVIGPIRLYVLGLLTPKSVYLSISKVASIVTRGATLRTKSLGPNSVEIISTPKPGVQEHPFQCKSRFGCLESLAKPFTGKYATVAHPECTFKGDKHCRYIVTWEMPRDFRWRKRRNVAVLFGSVISAATFFVLPLFVWGYIPLISAIIAILFSVLASYHSAKGFSKSIQHQGDAAEELIKEINTRHSHSQLVQNIGLVTSVIRENKDIISTAVSMIEEYLGFCSGFIMLANEDETLMKYVAGYGFTRDQEAVLKKTEIPINTVVSNYIYQICFNGQKPFLMNDVNENTTAVTIFWGPDNTRSLICVPIIYEFRCYGVLVVTNTKKVRVLGQADLNIVMGVASQIALSIANKNTFNELIISEKNYRDLIENTNSIIMRQTPEGAITFINEFAQRYFGYTENEVLKKNLVGVILPETEVSKKYVRKLSESLQQNPQQQIVRETKCRLKNNKWVWITWTHKPIFNQAGELTEILCVGNDITALKSEEIEKRDLQFQLQKVRKLEAIGTFAGGIAHDFNNILGSIILNTELAYNETKENELAEYALNQVLQSGKYAKDLVKRILSFARKSDIALKPLRIAKVVLDTVKLLKAMFPSTIVIREEIEYEDAIIMGDETQIQQMIINLSKNAAQAMGVNDGGLLTISLTMTDSGIRLSVRDNGHGISPDILDRIFDPFFTTKPVGVGTGLGLSIVQRIVQDHKGEIDIESRADVGTTFHIYFPVKESKIKLVTKDKYHAIQTGHESVFLIDDETLLLDVNKRVLEKLGYVVTTSNDSKAALQKFKENPYVYDLVITDMTMPLMSGDKLAEEFKQIRPDIPIILCTGYSEYMDKHKAARQGIDRFLSKPINMIDFSKAIREVLDRQKILSDTRSAL